MQVFISHAINDPDWPQSEVEKIAKNIKESGATVWLDYWEERGKRRKLSIDEWRAWMREGVGVADRVIFLLSPIYFECAGNGEIVGGRGVKLEVTEIDSILYDARQQKIGWIFTITRDGVNQKDVTPRFIRNAACSYQYPSEDKDLYASFQEASDTSTPNNGDDQPTTIPDVEFSKFPKIDARDLHNLAVTRFSAIEQMGDSDLLKCIVANASKSLGVKASRKKPSKQMLDVLMGLPAKDCRKLFLIIQKSIQTHVHQQKNPLSGVDRHWLVELTCYATLLGLDWNVWQALSGGTVASKQADSAAVMDVPTACQWVSAMGVASLMGLRLVLGNSSEEFPDKNHVLIGVRDFKSAGVKEWEGKKGRSNPILKALYDQIFHDSKPRTNKDSPLTEKEIGDVRTLFYKQREETHFCGVFIESPPDMTPEMRQYLGACVAKSINGLVILGNTSSDDSLVVEPMMVGDLESNISEIFQALGLMA